MHTSTQLGPYRHCKPQAESAAQRTHVCACTVKGSAALQGARAVHMPMGVAVRMEAKDTAAVRPHNAGRQQLRLFRIAVAFMCIVRRTVRFVATQGTRGASHIACQGIQV